MRTIKFRGKRIDTGEWVYGSLLVLENGDCEIIVQSSPIDCDKISVDANTVGQFTGLLDKDGKEIYEGDILLDRYEDTDEELVDYYSEVGIGHACFGYITGNKEFLPFFLYDITEVVVGNIHDNLELLKGGKE